jgi:uncharacterized membrane protein
MTDAQGDLLGSAVVLFSTVLLLIAVHLASASQNRPEVKWLVVVSILLSIAGVATVILT